MTSQSSSTLDNALGSEAHMPAQWYMNQSKLPPPPSPPQYNDILPPPPPQYIDILQTPYQGQDKVYMAMPSVSFREANGDPTMLSSMLGKGFTKEGWEAPWTDNESVGQKITIRVRTPREGDEGQLGCEVDMTMNARDFQTVPQIIAKAKLAHRIATALLKSDKFAAYLQSQGIKFEDVALSDLVNASQGSWQPTLHVRVVPPNSI